MKAITLLSPFLLLTTISFVNSSGSSHKKKNNKRLIGGDRGNEAEFPYQVSVRAEILPFVRIHICSGSIITADSILTSANCASRYANSSLWIRAGIQRFLSRDGVWVSVSQRHVHEGFDRDAPYSKDDVAVLRLSRNLTYGNLVRPIAMPERENGDVTGNATLTAWGTRNLVFGLVSPQLVVANVTLTSLEVCRTALNSTTGKVLPVEETNLCTLTPGVSACYGDGGSPLAQSGVLIGVVSWVVKPCDWEGAPTVYTRVDRYLQWINNRTGTTQGGKRNGGKRQKKNKRNKRNHSKSN